MAIKVCCACGTELSRQTTQLCRRCYLSGPTRICVSRWKHTKNKELIKKDLETFDRLRGKVLRDKRLNHTNEVHST